MAMNATNLKNEIVAAINAAMPDFTAYPNDHRVGLTKAQYDALLYGAIASAIVTHIQTNAKATGTDSRLDTHNLSII